MKSKRPTKKNSWVLGYQTVSLHTVSTDKKVTSSIHLPHALLTYLLLTCNFGRGAGSIFGPPDKLLLPCSASVLLV